MNAEGAVDCMEMTAAEKTQEKARRDLVIASDSAPLRDIHINIGLINGVESGGLAWESQIGRRNARHVALRRLRRGG